MLYEGGIRVPMAVRWPGVVKPGTTSDEPVIGIDLYPTLLEATQTKLQARVNLDGTSLLPLLSDVSEFVSAGDLLAFPCLPPRLHQAARPIPDHAGRGHPDG